MRLSRLAVLGAVAIGTGAVVGNASTLPIEVDATLQVIEVPVVVDTSTTLRLDPEPDRDDPGVWVCVVLTEGEPGWRLKPGRNPIHVSVNARDAQDGEAPEHPSYIVDAGDVTCVLPTPP